MAGPMTGGEACDRWKVPLAHMDERHTYGVTHMATMSRSLIADNNVNVTYKLLHRCPVTLGCQAFLN